LNGGRERKRKKEGEKKSMIIVVPSCLKDADGARTRSDQKQLRLNQWLCYSFGSQVSLYSLFISSVSGAVSAVKYLLL
jgi:hypothetical protein